ncbi:MAG: UDP-4-amino-4,6-dideoxy-N-acetyl-beta-L-altrosamine N-acetyltransferase [Betaproteobacteria bacterium]|nr:UDP-4-amino-4,6-dideoxy-N-acetyl-beta-L-altrosamine N-acetyltransferase [Betaproteobacteria bacterium]
MNVISSTDGCLRPLKSDDLERVLCWRNHPEVRRYMYTQHEIGLDEHTRWFERVSQDPDRQLLVFELAGEPLGFVNLHQIVLGIVEWGFYVAPDASKGTGRLLGLTTLFYVFNHEKFHKICGQTIGYNERAIRFHRCLGFKLEGTLRKQHYDGQQYHDVVYFGMLADEWLSENTT